MQLLHFFPLKLWLLIKDCCTCTSIHMHCISVNSLVTSRWLTSIQALSASRTCSRPYLHVYTLYMYIKTSCFNAASSREKRKIIWCLSLLVNVYRWTVVTPNIRDLVLNKLQNEMKFTPDFGFKITHAGELYERNNENRWLL